MVFDLCTDSGAILSFDQTGSIKGLTTPSVNWFTSAQTPLVRIRYADAYSPWEARDWEELSPRRVDIQQEDNVVVVVCGDFGGKDITITLTITAQYDRFACEIKATNQASGILVGIEAPIFGKLVEQPEARLYIPDRSGQSIAQPLRTFTERQLFSYPVPLSCQFITVNTGVAGWAMFCQDTAMHYKEIGFGGAEASVSLIQYPFIETGQSATLAPICLHVYVGSWHVTADVYRTWYNSWARQLAMPSLLRKLPITALLVVRARPVEDAILTDVTRSQEAGTFARAIERAMEMQARGIEGVHITGWHTRGHDTDYPDFTPSEIAGGRDEMRIFAAELKDAGLQVGYYVNGRLASLNSATYKQHPEWALIPARNEQASVRAHEHYGDEHFDVLCPCAPGFIAHLAERVEELARDFQADFIQLDQVGAAPGMLCFDPRHGHATPATAWAEGYLEMLPRLFKRAQPYSPGFWIFTEGIWEGAGQYVSLSQGGFWPLAPDAERFDALSHYIFPTYAMFGDGYWGGVPFIMDGPPPMQNGVITPAVRYLQHYSDFFRHSQYKDTIGLTWDQEQVKACWHQAVKQTIIVAYNPSDQPVATTLTLCLDQSNKTLQHCERLLTNETYAVEIAGDRLTFSLTLAPQEVDGIYLHWN